MPYSIKDPRYPDRYLVFDAFVTDNNLYLVSTYYGKDDVDCNDIRIKVNNIPAVLQEEGINYYEPVRYWFCPINPAPVYSVDFSYKDLHTQLSIPHTTIKCTNIAIATLFKNDYAFIPTFYKYYKKQGVTQFYLYYNGDQLPADIYRAPDIEYVIWPYRYWNNEEGMHRHHAQTAAITTFHKKYLSSCNYLILCDLDEFIHHPTMILADYLSTQPNVPARAIKNYWSTITKYNSNSIELQVTSSPDDFYVRTKIIYTRLFNGFMSIHCPKDRRNIVKEAALMMCHAVDVLHKDRCALISKPSHVIMQL